VRAAESPVEVGLLSRDQFFTIMKESPPTVSLIENMAQERRQENLTRGLLGVRQ